MSKFVGLEAAYLLLDNDTENYMMEILTSKL